MRLILINQFPIFEAFVQSGPQADPDTVMLYCFEDFTTGPLADWEDRAVFHQARSAFWATTTHLDLPDGIQRDFSVWHQLLPPLDVKHLVTLPEVEWPTFHEFEHAANQADQIEIWHDTMPRDLVWLWFLMAELPRIGVDVTHVMRCDLKNTFRGKADPELWSQMLATGMDRPYPRTPHSEGTSRHMTAL